MILNRFLEDLGMLFGVQNRTKIDKFSNIFLDKIFDRFLIDFGVLLEGSWEPKSMKKSIEIEMKIGVVSDIGFEPLFYRSLSLKFRLCRRALMSKLTHARRERIVQKHCKNHTKMQICICRMEHLASCCSIKFHKV